MSVQVITPPASSLLIPLSTVHLYLGTEAGDTTNDTLYTSLIAAASSGMIDYIGVHPGRQEYQESTQGREAQRRYLSRLPVELGTLTCTLSDEALEEGSESDQWSLQEPSTGLVYRSGGWGTSSSGDLNLIDQYYAGFLFPDQVSDWSATSVRVVGSWARSSSPSLFRFECTTAGTTGAAEPTWPTTLVGTVVDGSCVWTARGAQELPLVASNHCYSEFLRLLKARTAQPGLASRDILGVSESYFATHTGGPLALTTMNWLAGFRKRLGILGVA